MEYAVSDAAEDSYCDAACVTTQQTGDIDVYKRQDGINHGNLGVPVIAIGIPTVIDAVTIVSDAEIGRAHV